MSDADPTPGTPASDPERKKLTDLSVNEVVERTRDVIRRTREMLDSSRELLERVRQRDEGPAAQPAGDRETGGPPAA